MGRLNKNHWFVKDNKLSISLMRHYVDIEVCPGDVISFRTRVIDEDRKELVFYTDTLEEAITFTEEIVSKCRTNREVLARAGENIEYDSQEYISQKLNGDKLDLSEEEVKREIREYYQDSYNNLEVERELSLENDELQLHFYLVEKTNENQKRRVLLTPGDLTNVFDNYLDGSDYELVDFKYIGGVRRVGYFVDEDTPYFSGIQLQVRENIKQPYTKQKKESN